MLIRGLYRTFLFITAVTLVFSLASPVVLGRLATAYFDRIERLHPPGTLADEALRDMLRDGITLAYPMAACGRLTPCYASMSMYVGGNPFCAYWRRMLLQTTGRGPSAIIEAWIRTPTVAECSWSAHKAFSLAPDLVISSLRAEFDMW